MRILVPALICVGVFVAIVSTIDDYGLTSDEPYYIENSRAIEYWFSNADLSRKWFNYDTIYEYWRSGLLDDHLSGNVHPPFYKLSGIVFRHLVGIHLFDHYMFQYRVSTAFWATMLVLSLFFLTRRITGSTIWATLTGLSFISIPRFFAEAHLYTTDMMITALGFCGLTVFFLAASSRSKILFGGALFGAALATKFTGILAIAIVAPLILISDTWRRFARDYILMVLTACAFFCLFNFPVLFNPAAELRFYFSNFFDRAELLPLPTLYFGTVYGFHVPFHQPWVMLGITLPPLTVLTALLGMAVCAVTFIKKKDHLAYLALVPFLVCMTAYMLPSTPKHDGIRLFSTSWPFIILLSTMGCRWLQEMISVKYRTGMVIFITANLLALFQLIQYHPLQLSYYNTFIGGTKGADKNGFVVAYWTECFNKYFFKKAAQIIGERNGRIFSHPPSAMVTTNKAYNLFSTNLMNTNVKEDNYQYLLILDNTLSYEMLDYIASSKKLLEVRTPDGTLVGGLYENW